MPEQALVSEGYHAAHVGVAVFFGRHAETVAVAEHLCRDLSDALVFVALFIHLDEVSVFCPSCRIQYERDPVAVGYLAYLS